jgi:hypothetical protein
MPAERVLMGKLRIFGKKPGSQLGWLYDQANFLFKRNTPTEYVGEYDDFCRQVITATVEINKNTEGAKLVQAFKNIDFMVDILPTSGGGFFVPYCQEANEAYELPNAGAAGAVIVWDPSNQFVHSNTADGGKETLPPWVILAHEMGHAIQLFESGGGKQEWFTNYASNMEAVEMDNITRHETPIVTSLGKKPRVRYS